MSRDAQRSVVYAAEQFVRAQLDFVNAGASTVQIAGSSLTVPAELRFGSLEHAQRYLDQVQSADWYTTLWPGPARTLVTIRKRKGPRKAHYESGAVIAVPEPEHGIPWALREIVVLHELAHHLTPDDPGHGPQFCGAFVALVTRQMGHETGFLLTHALATHNVTLHPVTESP